jgi:Family of unknown function (DUF5947)
LQLEQVETQRSNQTQKKMSDEVPNRETCEPIGNRQSANGNGIGRPDRQADIATVLRRFVKPRSNFVERCDLCSVEVAHVHAHLIEPATRKLVCACQACAILFSSTAEARYKRVPERVQLLGGFQISDADWDGLMIPINMAFFFHSSAMNRVVALYPSPAGATESLLDDTAWGNILESNPGLKKMECDTQALLVNRVGQASHYYIVPIDECFKLVGLIRTKWKGLGGGQEVWQAIDEFFRDLQNRSVSAEVAHA